MQYCSIADSRAAPTTYDQIEHAQQALTLALGNNVDPPFQTMRVGQEVTADAIAQMLGWVLLVDLSEDA